MPSIAAHITAVPGSGIRRIHEIALTMDDVISLAVGEPDVAVSPHIGEAAAAAWQRDATNYTANGGIAPLRRAIVQKLARDNDVHVDTEQADYVVRQAAAAIDAADMGDLDAEFLIGEAEDQDLAWYAPSEVAFLVEEER